MRATGESRDLTVANVGGAETARAEQATGLEHGTCSLHDATYCDCTKNTEVKA